MKRKKLIRKKPYLLIFITVFSAVFIANHTYGEETIISKDGLIGINIHNRPLNEVLKDLSKKIPLEIKGSPVSGDPVSLNLTGVSLEETLKRLMRGYNYVLIKPENSEKQILMVLGRAERTKYVEPPPQTVRTTPPPPQPIGPPPPPPTTVQKPGSSQPQRRLAQPTAPNQNLSPGMQQTQGTQGGTTSAVPSATDPLMPPSPQVTGLNISPDLLPPMPPGMSGLPSAVRARGGSTDLIPPQIPSVSTGTTNVSGSTTNTSVPGTTTQPVTSTGAQTTILPPSIPTVDTTGSATTTLPAQPTTQPSIKETPDLRPPSIPGM